VSETTFQNHGVAALLEKFIKNREFLRGNRPATLRFYAEKLDAFKCFLGDRQEITRNIVEDFLAYLCRKDAKGNTRNKPGAVNCYLRAIRVFFNWCVEEDYLIQNPAAKVKYLRGEHKLVHELSVSDQQKILAAIKRAEGNPGSRSFALRNGSIFLLMLDTGIRPGEVCHLRIGDLDLRMNTIKVDGKTGQRIVPFETTVRKALLGYLRTRKGIVPDDPLFEAGRSCGFMNPNSLKSIFFRLQKRTGVKVFPYMLRHTAATAYLRGGAHSSEVSRLLGHSPGSRVLDQTYSHLVTEDLARMQKHRSPANKLASR